MAEDDYNVQESKITYTTKELLQRIDERFERMEITLQDTPTRKELDHLVTRLSVLEAETMTERQIKAAFVLSAEDRSVIHDQLDSLQQDATEIKLVSNALSIARKARWSTTEKIVGLSFVAVNLFINALVLHLTAGF